MQQLVKEDIDPSCNLIFGSSIDPDMHDEVEITIIATGFHNPDDDKEEEQPEEVVEEKEEPKDKFEGFNPFGYNPQAQMQTPRDVRVETNETSSRVDVNPTPGAVPPWIEKIRNKNRK